MSNPFYNPYAPGNKSSTQGQYGQSNTQTERDPRRAPPFHGPNPTFSSPGTFPMIPEHSMNYRPEPSRAIRDEGAQSSMDMHIGRAREDMRPPSTPVHQPMDQGPRFTSTQMEDFRSSGTGRASYPMTSTPASLGRRREMDLDSSSGPMNWSKNYARLSDAGSSLKSASVFSKYASGDDGRLNDPEDRDQDMQRIPGLGDYDFPASSNPGSSTESSQPMYTSESAATILLRFGLEKEDLEHLIAYPEDQITPGNLPFILRQIRLEKDKKAATAAQSSPYLEPQPNRKVTGPSNYSLNSPGGALMQPEETVSAVLQPSKVIDYGHTGKYMTGVGDEFGLKSDRDNSSGSGSVFMNREPLQKSTTECKSSTLGSASEQASSFPGLSSSYSSLRPAPFSSKDPPPIQPKQTFQDILSSFSLLKKDTDLSIRKPEASKPVPLSQPEVDRHPALKTQPPPAQSHGLHPTRPGLVLIGSSGVCGAKNSNKTPCQSPQQPRQQAQKQPPKQAQTPSTKPAQKQPAKKQPQQQSKKQTQQPQKNPASQKGQAKRSPVYGRSASPGDAKPRQKTASKRPVKDKATVSKDQPTPEMMRDYAAAPPKKFPHICVLCNTECTDMKDWITHQNSSFHLESCRLLRKQYPKWDGEIVLGPRVAGKTGTASTSAKKDSHGSHSHSKSISPHRQPCPEGRRDKRRSRSRSPQTPRYNRRYDLPSTSSYRSRSQSPGRRKDDRQSSPRRTRDRRSPLRRSNESPSPPRRVDNRWSPPRRIGDAWLPPRKGDGMRSSPRRSADSRSPPRRAEDRWTPPKRFDKGRSPPRRHAEKRSPPRRSEDSRSPSGRSQERRTSREGSSPPRKKSNNAENLAKKLLETSGVQSLSNKSDLEAVVKTLAPVLFAELAKMKSSSPSSLAKGGKSSAPSSSTKPSLSSKSSSSSMAKAKKLRAASLKAKTTLQKNEVKLRGIDKILSHDDVAAALERYGKTKAVVLYRSRREAVVNFENEEAANKLRDLKYVDVKGTSVTVVKVALTKKQVKAPLLKSATTKVQTATPMGRKTLLPTPKIPPLMGTPLPGAQRGTPGKVVNQKAAAKGSANVTRTVSKAKVLVSKAKNVLSPSSAKTATAAKLPAKGQEKTAAAKQEQSVTSQQKKPDTGDTRGQPISVLTGVKRPAVMLKDTLERDRSVKELPKASSGSSQAQAVPTVQKTPLDKVSGAKTTPKSQNPPHGKSSKPSQPESKESVEGSKDTAESGKASPPTMVKLHGIQKSVSHSDVLSAVAKFGKTKSIVLFRARSEAVVIFEKEEDAKKLKSVKSLTVNGMEITIVGESSISPSTETTKESVVGQKETLAGEKATVKNDAIENQSGLENSKPEETKTQEFVEVSEAAAKAADGANLPDKTKVGKADNEPVELGVAEIKEAELVEVVKERETTPGKSPEKPKESQPSTSSVQQNTLMQKPETGSSQVQQPAAGNTGAAEEAKIASGATESTPQGMEPAMITPSVMKPESSDEKLPPTEDRTKTCVVEDPIKTEGLDNWPDTKLLSVPETSTASVEITGVGVKDRTECEKSAISRSEVDKSEDGTVDELAKQPLVKDEVLPSEAEMVVPKQEPKDEEEMPGESEAVKNTETQPPEESLKPDQSETKAEVSLEASKALADVAEKAEVPFVEDKDQEKVSKADKVDEPMEVGETGPMELKEAGICTESKGAEAVPEKQPETRTEASQVKEQAAGNANDTAVDPKVLSGGKASKTQKATTAKAEESPKTASKGKTAPTCGSKQKPASKKPSAAVIEPTIGEQLEKHLFPQSIHCLQSPHISPSSYNEQLLICNLPTYHDGLYTEDDVANLLAPFGFKNKQENLYVIPQTCMAFATMSSIGNVYDILKESQHNGIYLKENRLSIKIIRLRYQMKVLQFYRFLKRLMKCYLLDEGGRTFLIRNISSSKIRELRQALEDFGPVSNFMPLLNKLFLEFECAEDAARFEGWYSLLGQAPGCKVVKLYHIAPSAAAITQLDSSAKDANLTFGERIEHHLTKQIIASLKRKNATTPKMLVTWLPAYEEGCYTEDDIVELLTPFGYQHKDHNIYVVPQACLAFVQMPSTGKVSDIIRASKKDPVLLKESKLSFHPMDDVISMSPFRFYKSLMELVKYRMKGDRDGVILIRDISPSETRDLRDVLERHGSVKNFLPLLNKVFIEFKSCRDADWLGVWYSLLKQPPNYRIQRLKIPTGCHIPPAPQFPNDVLLDRDDLVEGATLPGVKVFLPQISPSPFWISLRNSPFVFPTISPWFVIPMFKTVIGTFSIEKATRQGSLCPTIMLTGLPEGNYKHEDVARLVWPYFTKQNLHSLYYNVTVLPLQRRAFVYFADWAMCCEFVQAHIAERLVFQRKKIGVHIVTQNMYPESSEEKMYRSMMMWSNAGVPDPASLEDRLLCVEVAEVSLDVITLVIEMVASITTFVNFLPLGNRICFEMTDSDGVTQVVEKYNDPSTKSFRDDPAWSKVKNFESVESLKKRLQDSGETIINLESDLISGDETTPEMDKDLLKAITVTVGQQRLVQKGRSQSIGKQGQEDDFTEDNISSEAFPDAYLFDEEQFNEEEFVTVDEVYEDEDKGSESHRHSSSRHSSRKRPSSSVSSSRKKTSTRSSKDHTSTSSSSTSRSTKSARPSNSSSDLKNSSKPTKSSSKTSSSSSASKATSSCPPKSSSTRSSVDKKTQRSGTKSLEKSSSASEREKHASQKASLDTQKGKVEADDTESAVAKSDHTVSAEGPAAETVESETKIETTREMHPPQQEHGLDLKQTQDMEHDLNANKDKVESQEDEEEDGKLKGLEEVHSINCQTATSSDDQTEKKMQDGGQDGSSTPQITGLEGGQVLDGVKVESKAHPEAEREMDIEGPPQVREGATKEEEAGGQEDSGLVQEDSSTLKQPSKEDAVPIADKSDDRIQETNKEDNPVELDTGGKETQTSKGEEKNTEQEEKEVDGKATKETGNLQKETPNEDQPNKDTSKESDSEQDAFEILDSIDDQAEAEGEKFETSSVEASKDGTIPVDEGEYQVIDSVEVQAASMETKNKQRRSKRGEAVATKEDRPSRRGGPSSKASKSETAEESTNKQAKTVKKNQARTKIDSKEEMVFEIVDSVEEEQVEEPDRARESTGRRRSTRGKKDEKPEEITYKVLDSVENEVAGDEPAVSTRSTRGRRGRATEEALKEPTPTRKRQTPARESKSREKTPKKEEKAHQKEITPTKESASTEEKSEEAATYEILDSVEEEVINDDKPTARGKGKRGRPKREVKSTRKDHPTPKKADEEASGKEASEEVSTFEILDSVEDESNNDQAPSDQSGNTRDESIPTNNDNEKEVTENEEEEPLFQIVDSLEEDAVQEETTVSKDESKTKDDLAGKDGDACSEEPEKLDVDSLCQTADDLNEINEEPSVLEGSGPQDKERTSKSDIKESLLKSQSDTVVLDKETGEESPEKEQTTSVLVNLDEVSDEEEDYPDDTAEEEELRKRQAAKEKQLAIKQEVRSTRERERRSRSNSSKGGEDEGGSRRGKRGSREEEKGDIDSQELVTLDEVGADEAKDENVPERQELEEETAEGEAQTLVTLDEFVEDEAEGQDEGSKLEDQLQNQEDQSAEDPNQETLVTLDEACYDEEEPPSEEQGKTELKSAKRKHDNDDTEESMNFVIVDEVKDEEKGETSTSRTKGRPKKKGRQTPVRKSTRGNNVSTQEENEENAQTDELPPSSLEASSPLSKSLTQLTTEGKPDAQRTAEAEAASQPNTLVSSAEIGEEEEEQRSRADMKVVSKQRREHDGPEAKRSRSRSPSVPSDFKLPEFIPNNPLGKEFVVPGYFCSLCSVFYKNENTAKEVHCSSQKHFNKLQKHYQELQQKSRSSTPSQGSFSE